MKPQKLNSTLHCSPVSFSLVCVGAQLFFDGNKYEYYHAQIQPNLNHLNNLNHINHLNHLDHLQLKCKLLCTPEPVKLFKPKIVL